MTFAEGRVQDRGRHFEPWLDRYEAIGRAQHRYMYLLLVLVAFFLVVDGGPGAPAPDSAKPLGIEFLHLDVPRLAVWALGPPVIAFMLLAFLGTFAAARVALKGLEASAPAGLRGDAYDRVPNLIDFAVHTKGDDPLLVRVVPASSYPCFATAVLLSIAYLAYRVWNLEALGWVRWAAVIVTLL